MVNRKRYLVVGLLASETTPWNFEEWLARTAHKTIPGTAFSIPAIQRDPKTSPHHWVAVAVKKSLTAHQLSRDIGMTDLNIPHGTWAYSIGEGYPLAPQEYDIQQLDGEAIALELALSHNHQLSFDPETVTVFQIFASIIQQKIATLQEVNQ